MAQFLAKFSNGCNWALAALARFWTRWLTKAIIERPRQEVTLA
jgi:hypothetical protein